MATVTKLGPADHGRAMTYDEFLAGDYEEGYQYELIDGRLYVSPQPNLPRGRVEKWVYDALSAYARERPDVINFVYNKARVFVPNRPGVTNPEPDVAAYRDFPLDLPPDKLEWQDVQPVLVVEVLSADDPDKDLVRNVALYLEVPAIKEYWIIDAVARPARPTMGVFRRHGKRWRKPLELDYGAVYATKLLPDFELIIDPWR